MSHIIYLVKYYAITYSIGIYEADILISARLGIDMAGIHVQHYKYSRGREPRDILLQTCSVKGNEKVYICEEKAVL